MPLLLQHMLALYGVQEIHGPLSNPVIDGWIAEVGWQNTQVRSDNDQWCCLPLAVSAQRSDYPLPENAPWSRSWASWGAAVAPGHERLGDVVVLTRGHAKELKGHVGVAMAWEPKFVGVLGGNTKDAVAVGWYERNERILSLRRPEPQWLEREVA